MKKRLFILFLILVAAFLLRVLVFQSYRSATDYMEDTLAVGDYFLVNKFVFGRTIPFTDMRLFALREPRRGDVVVFEYPEDPGKDFVMRVVGIPGDEVEGKDKQIYINGRNSVDSRESHREREVVPREQNPRDNFGPVKVPADALFVMGDNRDRSYDSRFWGCVPYGKIKGLAFLKYWSWDPEQRRLRWGNIGKSID
ncbi:MAG TPA: signal peptidase I [Geobacteraceae bacterium]|nr:signal peptidase I [Geobacteraceae bacterium]